MEMDKLTTEDLVSLFLKDCETRGMSPRSLPGYKSALKMFAQYLQQHDSNALELSKETLREFIDYMRQKDLSQRSLEITFSVLSSFYEYLTYEGHVQANPVLPIRKRYLKRYKDNDDGHERKLISVEEMARMINSEMNIRNRAIILLLAKTGIRRNELVTLDVSDVDFIEQKIRLKPTAKRNNRTVFFDDETAWVLKRWLRVREGVNRKRLPALFLNQEGKRLDRNGVYEVVSRAAERVGLHDRNSERIEDHFGPHCCRHWFCTWLWRNGMRREFVKELRGDSKREAFDIYNHIDLKELKEAYLAAIPQLGI